MHNPFDREDLQAPLAEINMTPLVDVMLVLLVIFLVTAPMLNQSINLNLPGESAAAITDQKTLTIAVDASGKYYLNDKPVSDAMLEETLREQAKEGAKQSVHIRADTAASYGKVSHALALLQQNGFTNIGFVTQPK
mgnify:CR=1 FL=1